MSRIKKGLDYFCFSTDSFNDLKFKRLRRLCGNDGLLVYIFLISEAYRVEGYFLKVSEELVFDLSERFHLEESEIAHIIETCCHEGLFCESIYSRYQVLTSAEMQERYIEICIRLRRTEINIQSDYILTELPESQSKSKNLRVIGKDAAGDSSNIPPTVCPQRKEMKRNEKKSHPSLPSPEKGRGEDAGRPVGTSAVEDGGDTLRLPLDEVSDGTVSAKAPAAPVTHSASDDGIDILPDPHTPCPHGEGRNYVGMVEALQRFRLPVRDINAILKMSNFGEIGDPAWRAIYEVNNSGGSIRHPAKYIYSVIQKARKRQEGGAR